MPKGVIGLIDLKRFIQKSRPVLSGIGLVAVVALMFWLVSSPAVVGVSAAARKLPVYSVQRDDKVVSLSFDAAWGNEDTQQLIDILEKYGVKTTFFVVGDWVEKYPESVKALAEAGHEVMNHSSNHAHFSQLSSEQIASDLATSNERIAAVTGVTPTLFRCPYGEYDDHVIEAVSTAGMTAVQWNVDSLDWKGISADEITSRVLKNVTPGSIVLFHNAAENTPEALPRILEALLADGYSVIPVSQILLAGDTIIDHTGRQCPSAKSAI